MQITPNSIEILNASSQNLNNVSLDIARGQITILSGPSSCGKTALAINTIGSESQYRLEVLNGKKIGDIQRPAVDKISHLPPCLILPSIGPAKLADSVMSFLGADSILGRLAQAAGIRLCPRCQNKIIQQNQSDGLNAIFKIAPGKTISVVGNLYKKPDKNQKLPSTITSNEIDKLISQGFVRLVINQEQVNLDNPDTSWRKSLDEQLMSKDVETVGVVVDRLSVSESNRSRLAQSVESAARIGRLGITIYEINNQTSSLKPITLLGHGPSCLQCGYESFILSPSLFDFRFNKKGDGYLGLSGLPTEHCDELLKITIDAMSVRQILEERIDSVTNWINQLPEKTRNPQFAAFSSINKLLVDLGLEYLSFNRITTTLSSGEWHRLKIARLLSRRLPGIMYILDMPSLYLHAQDRIKLAQTIANFQSSEFNGSAPTVLLVDNSPELFRLAVSEINLGTGPGRLGGKVMYIGQPRPNDNKPSKVGIKQPSKSEKAPVHLVFSSSGHLNIKPFNVSIPLASLVVVRGVSGSGKTVFVFECLLPALNNWLAAKKQVDRPTKSKKSINGSLATKLTIEGNGSIRRAISLPVAVQSPHSSSSVARQTGLLEILTKLFAMLPLSKQRGYTSKDFDLESSGNCSPELLEVRFKGYTIDDVLKLSISTASSVFANLGGSQSGWKALHKLNLEHLPLGRAISALSTSEWQRLALIPILVRPSSDTIFLIDYPCAGLDYNLTAKVAGLLKELAQLGNTVVVIDNSDEFESVGDCIIEVGPSAGLLGGNVTSAPWNQSAI